MAFTVETGAIVADANAYIDVAYFRAFHVDRGVTAAGSDTGAYGQVLVEAAIIRATDYVDKRFGTKFKGWKSQSTQSLQWPRIDVEDSSGYLISSSVIPKALKYAVSEYAKLALTLVLLPTPPPPFNPMDPSTGTTTTVAQGALIRNRTKAGSVESDKTFADMSKIVTENRANGVLSGLVSSVYLPEYPIADEWLKEITVVGNSFTLERA